MKTTLERIFFGLILAPLAPLAGFMAGWWISYTALQGIFIAVGALAGLCLGIVADVFLLKRWVERASQMNTLFWATIFLFYTVGIFGFFMGVPVFNALLAIPAGFVVAARTGTGSSGSTGVSLAARRAAWFTTGVLFVVCAASAFIALASRSTAADLKGMLGLSFEVTQGMILGLILVGGSGLLAGNWGLAWVSTRLAYKFLGTKRPASGNAKFGIPG